jgi:hypothetical protein
MRIVAAETRGKFGNPEEDVAVGSRYQTNGENIANKENLVRAIVNCRL